MKKKEIFKIFCIFFFWVVLGLFVFNYLSYGRLNFNNFINEQLFLNNYKKEVISNKMLKKVKISTTDPNGVGTVTYNYDLKIDNLNFEASDLAITFNGSNYINYNTIINYYNDSYSVSDFESFDINKNTDIIFLNGKRIKSVEVKYSYDVYGTNNKLNDIGSVTHMSFNNKNIKDIAKHKMLIYLLIYSFIYFIFVLTLYSLKKIKINSNFNYEKNFAILGLVFGVAFSILMPIYQVPDEKTHIEMIYKELGYKNIQIDKYVGNYQDESSLIRNFDKKVNEHKYLSFKDRLNTPFEFHLPKISIIKHLPQSIPIIFGTLFNWPVLLVFSLSELFGILFYVFVGYKTLKYLPLKKDAMFMIMLLPICVQQYSSFSYDCVTNAMCFFLVSYILYIKFAKDNFTNKDLLLLLFTTMVIAICKLPYALLLMLCIFIPLEKYQLKIFNIEINYDNIRKNKKIYISLLVSIFILFIIACGAFLPKLDIGRNLLAAIFHPRSFIKLLLRTVISSFTYYIDSTFGLLGWFDVYIPKLIEFLTIMFLIILFIYDDSKYSLNKFEKIFSVLFFIILSSIIILSLLNWTFEVIGVDYRKLSVLEIAQNMNNINYIGGVQGRYFIPFIILLALPFNFKKINNVLNEYKVHYLMIIFLIILYFSIFIILINRYWI